MDGGDDGLDFYRIILRRYAANLRDGGFMLFECGIGQAFGITAAWSAWLVHNDQRRFRDV